MEDVMREEGLLRDSEYKGVC